MIALPQSSRESLVPKVLYCMITSRKTISFPIQALTIVSTSIPFLPATFYKKRGNIRIKIFEVKKQNILQNSYFSSKPHAYNPESKEDSKQAAPQ